MPELTPELLQRLRDRASPPPPPRKPVPWLQILLAIFALGAMGWGLYQHWYYRLPQERTLTTQDGKSFPALLQAHDADSLQVVLTASGQTRYLPLASLSSADQDFIRHTKSELIFKFPLDYTLTDASGREIPVRLESRNSEWVKVTYLADQSQTFLPIDQLTLADQTFVNRMKSTLNLLFPVNYTFTGPPQPGVNAHLLGRTEHYLRYQSVAGNAKIFVPTAKLSKVDQSFVQRMPNSLPRDYPLDFPLTTAAGLSLPGLIANHNYDLLKLQLPQDGSTRYFPIKLLSEDSRNFIREVPGDLIMVYPLDCTVADSQGKTAHLQIVGRSQEVLKLATDPGSAGQYLPLADLSPEDQEVFRLLPTNLSLAYPISYALTDLLSHTLNVQILGHSADEVKFQLTNGTVTNYALGKLSPASQKFIRLLPDNLSGGATPSLPLGDTAEIKLLRDHIAQMQAQNTQLREHAANPTTSSRDKIADRQAITNNEVQISLEKTKLDALLYRTSEAKPGPPSPARSAPSSSFDALSRDSLTPGTSSPGSIRFVNTTGYPLTVRIGDAATIPLKANGTYTYVPPRRTGSFIVRIERTDVQPPLVVVGSQMSAPSSGFWTDAVIMLGNAEEMQTQKAAPAFNLRFDSRQ